MLKLISPLELKIKPNITTTSESFGKRMIGNYEIASASFNADELLHFFTAPAEIYLGENGANSFVNITSNRLSQDVKVELINNVLNRIVLAEENNLTYQDRVFIEQTLLKLGITDVQQFMREITVLKTETDNIHALMNLYWENYDNLVQISSMDRAIKADTTGDNRIETTVEQPRYYLHQSIYDRLDTANIYHELKNYIIDSKKDETFISRSQMQISEQNTVFNQMLTNVLKNNSLGVDTYLIYNKVNSYELIDEDIEEVNLSTMQSQLVKAIMVNAISSVYDMKYDSIISNEDRLWFNMAKSIHEITENTYKRFENFHITSPVSDRAAVNYHNSITNNQLAEIDILYNVFNDSLEEESIVYSAPNNTYEQSIVHKPTTEVREVTVINADNLEPEEYARQLEIINEKNIEKAKQFAEIQAKETTKKRGSTKIDRRKAMADALRAIEGDTKVLQEYIETPTRTEEKLGKVPEVYRQVYDPETIEILEAYYNIQNNRPVTNFENIQFNSENTLLKDVNNIENEINNNQKEITYRFERVIEPEIEKMATQINNETNITNNSSVNESVEEYITEIHNDIVSRYEQGEISLITDQILELAPTLELGGVIERQLDVLLPRRVETVRSIISENVSDNVSLTHKNTENQIDEEFLEELINRRDTTETKRTENEHATVTTTNVERTVETKINEVKVNDEREMVRFISENIDSRIGELSEQVYSRLEKKMDRERRRRGI